MKIKLIVDSTCDLTPELIERSGISEVLPLYINMDTKEFRDGEFSTEEIYKFVKETGKLPKTAALSVHDFRECFAKHTADGSAVLHFSISSKLSVSAENARTAAKEFNNVFVIDSKHLSTGTSLLILFTHDLLKKNPKMTAREASEILNSMRDRVQSSFCVDTINYLYKGGRCSALALFSASILKIHPSLHLKDGLITVGKKYMGNMKKVIISYIRDLRAANPNYDETRCFITYTSGTDPEIVAAARAETERLFEFKEILETTAGSTITSHCGLGTLGLLFINK